MKDTIKICFSLLLSSNFVVEHITWVFGSQKKKNIDKAFQMGKWSIFFILWYLAHLRLKFRVCCLCFLLCIHMLPLFGTVYYSITPYGHVELEESITINIQSFLKEIENKIDFVLPRTLGSPGPNYLLFVWLHSTLLIRELCLSLMASLTGF